MLITENGSITQVEKNKSPYQCRKWLLQVRTNHGRFSKRFKGCRREAQVELNNGILDLENDAGINKESFSNYLDYYMRYRKSLNTYSPNTIRTEEKLGERLKEIFGDYMLNEITPRIIRDKFSDIKNKREPDKQISNTQKCKMQDLLNAIFKMAKTDKCVSENPCESVDRIKRDTKEKRALERKEFDALIKALGTEPLSGRVMFIYFMAYLGLRRQESVSLKGEDGDKENNVIKIQRAYKEADQSEGKTKSRSSRRDLPIPKPLQKIMKQGEVEFKNSKLESDGICCHTKGQQIRGGDIYLWGKRFNQRHNLRYVTFHELRHTNFTLAARYLSTFDLKDLAGGCDLAPAQIYIHKNQESLRKGIDKIFADN